LYAGIKTMNTKDWNEEAKNGTEKATQMFGGLETKCEAAE